MSNRITRKTLEKLLQEYVKWSGNSWASLEAYPFSNGTRYRIIETYTDSSGRHNHTDGMTNQQMYYWLEGAIFAEMHK
jgi:hypothetical protein